MTLRIILLIFIFSPLITAGQTQLQIDSIDSLVTQVIELRKATKYDEALKLANQTLAKSLKANYFKGQAGSYLQIGRISKILQAYDEALDAYEKGFYIRLNILKDTCKAAGTRSNMVSTLDDKFHLHGDIASLELAIAYSKEAENLAQGNTKCNEMLVRIYINQANIYESIGRINDAITSNRNNLKLLNSLHDTTLSIITGYGLAKRYINNQQFDSARIQLTETLKLLHQYSETDSILVGQLNEALGVIELNAGSPEKALEYFNISKEIYEKKEPEDKMLIPYLYFNIAKSHEKQDHFMKAKEAYEKARLHQSKVSTTSPFYTMFQTQEKFMSTKEEKRKSERKVLYALFSIALLSIVLLIISVLLSLKTKVVNKLQEQHYQLKHDIIKNGLRTIDNHIIADLPGLKNDREAYNLILKIKGMVRRILSQIGYQDDQSEVPARLKAFAEEMHHRASEISLMNVQNFSYLDEVEDYLLSENLRNNLEAIITEAFSNIQKHANSQTASINFTVDENGLSILIQDDGAGCNMNTISRSGLNTINQRVKTLNGSVYFESSIKRGFSIKINIPRFPESS